MDLCQMNYWVPIIKDIILSVAAIVTVCLAIYGVKSWRRELAGKTKFDAAKRQLQATFKIREAFWSARSRFIAAAEFPPGYGGTLDQPTDEKQFEAFLHVYRKRWEPLWDAIQEFDVAALESEVLWGESVKQKTDQIRACISTYRNSIDFELNHIRAGRDIDDDFSKKIRQDIAASRDDEDPLSVEMRTAINQIEEVLKPHLKH
jgi:hypothetical protein